MLCLIMSNEDTNSSCDLPSICFACSAVPLQYDVNSAACLRCPPIVWRRQTSKNKTRVRTRHVSKRGPMDEELLNVARYRDDMDNRHCPRSLILRSHPWIPLPCFVIHNITPKSASRDRPTSGQPQVTHKPLLLKFSTLFLC